ncbi:MAG TPA: nucleotide disphospho-sugar-binding domain-containing protein, partial [Pseudonocardiaceae bacterium]|nr:nucleotide disphospho-sugar-binding domain-containing protein [Pseudonocardiaceae bacterium]
LLLPHCHLVVSHGGAGIMLNALAHGLPQLILPQGADQFSNAAARQSAGAALALRPGALSADAIATAAECLITIRASGAPRRVSGPKSTPCRPPLTCWRS